MHRQGLQVARTIKPEIMVTNPSVYEQSAVYRELRNIFVNQSCFYSFSSINRTVPVLVQSNRWSFNEYWRLRTRMIYSRSKIHGALKSTTFIPTLILGWFFTNVSGFLPGSWGRRTSKMKLIDSIVLSYFVNRHFHRVKVISTDSGKPRPPTTTLCDIQINIKYYWQLYA